VNSFSTVPKAATPKFASHGMTPETIDAVLPVAGQSAFSILITAQQKSAMYG
jgi:hypothetical protein